MKYDVSWRDDAYLLLVEIWDESSDADDLMRAIGAIDSALSEDADTKGESRSDGRRVFFAPHWELRSEFTSVWLKRLSWTFGEFSRVVPK